MNPSDIEKAYLYGLTCDIRRLEHKMEKFMGEFSPSKKPPLEQIKELSIWLGEFQNTQQKHQQLLEIFESNLNKLKKIVEKKT